MFLIDPETARSGFDLSDPQNLASVVTATATVILAVITGIYAFSTSKAARYARDTAEASIVQNILGVQPRVTPATPAMRVDWINSTAILPTPRNWRVPVRVTGTFDNSGRGPAMAVSTELVLFGITFEIDEGTLPESLRAEGEVGLTWSVPAAQRPHLARDVEGKSSGDVGVLKIECADSVGFRVSSQWLIRLEGSRLLLARHELHYAAGGPEKGRHHSELLERWRWLLESRTDSD